MSASLMDNEGQYLELLDEIRYGGRDRGDRTGVGTRGVFGRQMRFDLSESFPLLTTKKVFWRGVKAELFWMLSGSTNIHPLVDQGVHIWDEWADKNGDLGPVYGSQWRQWKSPTFRYDFSENKLGPIFHDQIADVLSSLKNNPLSRRHIVTAWNPAEIEDMALPPCHLLFQFYCEPLTLEERAIAIGAPKNFYEGRSPYADARIALALEEENAPLYRLSCQLYQRSADMFLGVPFNIASYALLTHMVAAECNMLVGDFVHTLGDAHIYHNHFDAVDKQLQRHLFEGPQLEIVGDDFRVLEGSDFNVRLINYQFHPAIKAPVAV